MTAVTVTMGTTSQARRRPSATSVLRWMDLMETSEQFLLAGLRRRIGPDGDLNQAYREWYKAQLANRDGEIAQMLSRSRRLGAAYGD
jgi:hypothetical protein